MCANCNAALRKSHESRAPGDSEAIPQVELIAKEAPKTNPDLAVRDQNGDIYIVRYEAVNAMLLNEFLKEHRTVEELKATVAKQEKTIRALTAGLQKISERSELSRSTPQLVDNAH
jgi:hypothetical protein